MWSSQSDGYEVVSSGIQRRVARWRIANVSEEHVVSIFRVDE
jgi:hypothetical protein